MGRFSKIVDGILDSTLWEEKPEVRLVFLGMTFASDLDGNLPTRTLSSLARRLNLEEEYVSTALKVLEAPDPNSRNKAYDGARVVRTDGGWLVVSKREYVDDQTSKQVEWAEKKARWRARQALKAAQESHQEPLKPTAKELAQEKATTGLAMMRGPLK